MSCSHTHNGSHANASKNEAGVLKDKSNRVCPLAFTTSLEKVVGMVQLKPNFTLVILVTHFFSILSLSLSIFFHLSNGPHLFHAPSSQFPLLFCLSCTLGLIGGMSRFSISSIQYYYTFTCPYPLIYLPSKPILSVLTPVLFLFAS